MNTKKQTKNKKTQLKNKNRRSRPSISRNATVIEPDGRFLLKLIIVVILATLWLKFSTPIEWLGLVFTAIPIGVLAGMVLVHTFEHFQTDRKIWFTVLVVVGIVSYFVPAGIVI